jgi:organic radical activating enzyme
MTFSTAMRYLVKETFGPTLQGEGAHAGRPCVFLRFAICNLACTWCDTDFRPEGARRMEADEIARELTRLDVHGARMVVVTGGEPTLHWDAPLADAVRTAGFRTHMESNGTRPLRAPVDWLTFSPKPRFHGDKDEIVFTRADECKLVVDETIGDADLERWEAGDFGQLFVQPCMDARYDEHLAKTIALAQRHPKWRLSLQLHKILGVP